EHLGPGNLAEDSEGHDRDRAPDGGAERHAEGAPAAEAGHDDKNNPDKGAGGDARDGEAGHGLMKKAEGDHGLDSGKDENGSAHGQTKGGDLLAEEIEASRIEIGL